VSIPLAVIEAIVDACGATPAIEELRRLTLAAMTAATTAGSMSGTYYSSPCAAPGLSRFRRPQSCCRI
jgi:hypothetical protein